jgi:hypothetical protein
MAIGDFFSGLGQRVGRGLTEIGGYDPMEQVSPEQARMRRQEGLAALQRSLGKSSAILSGDPRRMQLAEEQMQIAESEKKESELNKKLDDAIDKSNLPQSQKDLLKSLNTQTKAQTLMQAFEPTKEPKAGEQIKIEELNVLRTLEALDGDVNKLNNYEKLIYKNFIEKEDSQSILQQLGLIPNNTSNQPLEIEEIKKG